MSTTTLAHGRVTWTDIVHPTPQDIEQLANRYPKFHPLHLQDCLTELEIPKLDHQDDYLFLVAQMPLWDSTLGFFRPAEVDIFIAQGILVSSHRGELKALVEMFARAVHDENARVEWMGKGASPLLYYLLNSLVDSCVPIVQNITHELRHIEAGMFTDDTRHLLYEVAVLRRNVTGLRSILNPVLEVVHNLERGNWAFIHEELDPYWGDIGDHLAQLCAILDENAEVTSSLSDTVDTLASHRIDDVVRLLTVVTVLTLPLTLLATIFGMNIVMPFAEHPLLFYTVTGLGVTLTLLLIWYLRRRSWL